MSLKDIFIIVTLTCEHHLYAFETYSTPAKQIKEPQKDFFKKKKLRR